MINDLEYNFKFYETTPIDEFHDCYIIGDFHKYLINEIRKYPTLGLDYHEIWGMVGQVISYIFQIDGLYNQERYPPIWIKHKYEY